MLSTPLCGIFKFLRAPKGGSTEKFQILFASKIGNSVKVPNRQGVISGNVRTHILNVRKINMQTKNDFDIT